VPYYYDHLHRNESVELNRCVYNQMADDPQQEEQEGGVNGTKVKKCLTGQQECEDCRDRNLDEIVSLHFTICQKPWHCRPHSRDETKQSKACRAFTHEWYRARSELERSWGRSGMGNSTWDREQFFGYCRNATRKGYTRIEEPTIAMYNLHAGNNGSSSVANVSQIL